MRNSLYQALFFVLFSMPVVLFAQKIGGTVSANDPFAFRKAAGTFQSVPLGNDLSRDDNSIPNAVSVYISQHNEHFNSPSVTLNLRIDKTSPGGRHFTFDQYYQGVKIFNSEVSVTIDKKNTIHSILDNSYNTTGWENYNLAATAGAINNDSSIINNFLSNNPQAGNIIRREITIAVINDKPAVYLNITAQNPKTAANRLYLLGAIGNIIYSHDLNRYASSIVSVSATPFVPDPLTRAGKYYGAPYVWEPAGLANVSDTPGTVLDSEKVNETIQVTDSNGIYYLKNKVIQIVDIDAPYIAPATRSTPAFNEYPSDTAFEDMNIFYNVSTQNAHIAAIGFDSLANFFTVADAHALSGQDNSIFQTGGNNQPQLLFGDGGVPDSQDADVVLHEYGHAISNNANGDNFGYEREALDEAQADYWGSSYSRSISEFRWAETFTWDGHNEYWPGRTADTTTHYPEGISNVDIWTDGEMWVSSVMQIWYYLGRDTTDRLMAQTLYAWAANMTMTQSALDFLQADSMLYNGKHVCLIANIFYARGFIDSTMGNFTCPLTGKVGIDDIDNVAAASDLIKVVNTDGFAFRDEPAMIENTGVSRLQKIELFDVTGRSLMINENIGRSATYIQSDGLNAGVYFVRVETADGFTTKKLVKVK